MSTTDKNKYGMDELNKIIDRYTEGNYLISKTAKEEMAKDILALFNIVGQSEQLKAIQDLKDHCSQRYEHWERDEIERLVDSL